jgi:muramoyltetrapeptide carboxypeptidase
MGLAWTAGEGRRPTPHRGVAHRARHLVGRASCGYPALALVRPPPLRPRDVVRVIAPSGPVDPAALQRGIDVLRGELGLEVRVRPDVGARRGYLAGDDARRLAEWREAAADPDARAIFCARGGYGAMRLLPDVDPSPLLRAPRWLVGFSDVTALHAVLNRAGLVTVHGPLVTTLGTATPEAKEHLRALLFDGPRKPRGVEGTGVIRSGHASGRLLGGSLTLLAHLCGTPWAPRLDGAILFFEDVDEKPYRLDRYLTQLRLSGALDGVRGVCVGQLTACDPGAPDEHGSGATVRAADVVRELVRALGVPALEGLPAGHERANFALPLGAIATLVAPAPGEDGPPRLLFDAEEVA